MNAAQRIVARYKIALNFGRDFYLPPQLRGTDPMVPEGTDLAIWTWEENGIPFGVAFVGKANKPLWNWRFRSEGQRQKQIDDSIKSRKSTLEYKQKRKDERKNYKHDFKVDDILYSSWGYDQTNVNFYQVVAVKGAMIEVREIGKKIVSESQGADYVKASKDNFKGPVIRVKPSSSGAKIDGHSASKWDGKPVYETAFGWGH